MQKSFTHNVKVYYEDTDAGGVVYYANYLKYLERARTEALSSIGLSNTKIKNDFSALIIVKSCIFEYKKSAYLEDDLQIKSFVESTSKTSFLMNQSIFKMKIYIIWLIGVIIWNFGFPNAIPIADVIAAILLSFLSIGLKKLSLIHI